MGPEHPYVDAAEKEGYKFVRILPTGEVAGIMPMLFTVALCVGIDEYSRYRVRYCFTTAREATASLLSWDGVGDPPGFWVKAKGERGGDRFNPRVFYGIPVVVETGARCAPSSMSDRTDHTHVEAQRASSMP